MNERELKVMVEFSNKRTRCRHLDTEQLSPESMQRLASLFAAVNQWALSRSVSAYLAVYTTKYTDLLSGIINDNGVKTTPKNSAIAKRIRLNIQSLDDCARKLETCYNSGEV